MSVLGQVQVPHGRRRGSLGRHTRYYRLVEELKRNLLSRELRRYGGNRSRTAAALGMRRSELLLLLRRYGVTAPMPRGPDPDEAA